MTETWLLLNKRPTCLNVHLSITDHSRTRQKFCKHFTKDNSALNHDAFLPHYQYDHTLVQVTLAMFAQYSYICTCMLCSFFVVDQVGKITRNYDKFSLIRCRTNACSSNSIHSARLFVAEYKKDYAHLLYDQYGHTHWRIKRGRAYLQILCTYLGQLLCHNYFFLISFEPYVHSYMGKKLTIDSNVFFIFHHPFTLTFINQ